MNGDYIRQIPTGHELDALRKEAYLSCSDLAREANVSTGQLEQILKHIDQMKGVKIGEVSRVAKIFGYKFIFFARDPYAQDAHPYPTFREIVISKCKVLGLGPDELARGAEMRPQVTNAIDKENYEHVKIGDLFVLTSYLSLRLVYHIRAADPAKRKSAWEERGAERLAWEKTSEWDGGPPPHPNDDDPLDFMEEDE